MQAPRATANLIPSLCAAAISFVIVLAEGHVQVSLADPSTWGSPFEHKCGLFMVACITWLLVEVVRSMFFPGQDDERTYKRFNGGFRRFSGRLLQ